MGTLLQILVRSLETGSIYALATLGIIIIFRTSHIVHFAQGTMGMFCTYVVTMLVASTGMPMLPAVLLGVAAAIAAGVAVDFVVIRRTDKVSAEAKQIVTLGLLMIFLGATPMLFGVDLLKLPKFIESGALELAGASLSYNGLLNIAIGLVIMFVLFYLLQKTKLGLAIRTTASNSATARMLGVPTKLVTMFSWALAGVLGCLAGVMIAGSTSVSPTLLDNVQNTAMIACVLGGFQTFYGPVLGAYLLGIGRNLLVFYVSSVWGEQLLYLLILVFIIFKPYGLIGKAPVKKV